MRWWMGIPAALLQDMFDDSPVAADIHWRCRHPWGSLRRYSARALDLLDTKPRYSIWLGKIADGVCSTSSAEAKRPCRLVVCQHPFPHSWGKLNAHSQNRKTAKSSTATCERETRFASAQIN